MIIQDLEQKLDSSLEEIALLQSENEDIKQYSEEQMQRLKQENSDLQMELQAQLRKIKELKFMQLLNSEDLAKRSPGAPQPTKNNDPRYSLLDPHQLPDR